MKSETLDSKFSRVFKRALQALADSPSPTLAIVNPKKAASRKGYTKSGTLVLREVAVKPRPSFLQYIAGTLGRHICTHALQQAGGWDNPRAHRRDCTLWGALQAVPQGAGGALWPRESAPFFVCPLGERSTPCHRERRGEGTVARRESWSSRSLCVQAAASCSSWWP